MAIPGNGGGGKGSRAGGGAAKAGGGGGGATASIMARQSAFNEAAAAKQASARQALTDRASATMTKINTEKAKLTSEFNQARDKYLAASRAAASLNGVNLGAANRVGAASPSVIDAANATVRASKNFQNVATRVQSRLKQLDARATRVSNFGDSAAGFSSGAGVKRRSIIRAANRG